MISATFESLRMVNFLDLFWLDLNSIISEITFATYQATGLLCYSVFPLLVYWDLSANQLSSAFNWSYMKLLATSFRGTIQWRNDQQSVIVDIHFCAMRKVVRASRTKYAAPAVMKQNS